MPALARKTRPPSYRSALRLASTSTGAPSAISTAIGRPARSTARSPKRSASSRASANAPLGAVVTMPCTGRTLPPATRPAGRRGGA